MLIGLCEKLESDWIDVGHIKNLHQTRRNLIGSFVFPSPTNEEAKKRMKEREEGIVRSTYGTVQSVRSKRRKAANDILPTTERQLAQLHFIS